MPAASSTPIVSRRARTARLGRSMSIRAASATSAITGVAGSDLLRRFEARYLPIHGTARRQRKHRRSVAEISVLSPPGRNDRRMPDGLPWTLEEAMATGRPEIFNSDQGAQFTAEAFTARLDSAGISDQHGWPRPSTGQRVHRAAVAKREVRGGVPARTTPTVGRRKASLRAYLRFYCEKRVHQSLGLSHAEGNVSRGAPRSINKCPRKMGDSAG